MEIDVETGIVVISVDTELAWGFIGYPQHYVLKLLRSDPMAGRNSIFSMLNLFNKYNIPVTWAIVGHLFLDSCDGDHIDMPRYHKNWYDADPGSDISNAPLYYGKDIVDRIISSPIPHEIACHTFSHVPFSSCNRDVALAEISKSKEVARHAGINLKSFIYPENKIGHIDALKENGFEIFRGANLENFSSKDSTIPTVFKSLYSSPIVKPQRHDSIWEIPGSMHFANSRFPFTIVPRCKMGVNKAIKHKQIFHIILHCWSLLLYKSLEKDLEDLLIFLSKKDVHSLRIMTMGMLASYLSQQKETRQNDK